MIINKVIGFGDSFTAGEGWNSNEELRIINKDDFMWIDTRISTPSGKEWLVSIKEQRDKYKEWELPFHLANVKHPKNFQLNLPKLLELSRRHSWVRHLADSFGVEWENFGLSGENNYNILNTIFKNKSLLNENSLVVIMWSSSLREKLHFFPKEEQDFLFWSKDLLEKQPERFIDSGDGFWKEYRKYFLVNLYDEDYFEYLQLNYIELLSKWFEWNNIPYVMCNAFEPIIPNKRKFKNYYKQNSSLFEDLRKTNKTDIWQDETTEVPKYHSYSHHPNEKGYMIISDLLKNFIEENNIL
jgi:hypothetical protein